jgi:phage terminase small subunit
MSKKPSTDANKPPQHLRSATAAWWADVMREFELEQHHVRLLTLAAESFDRCQEAREAVKELGLTYLDRHKQPRVRPEVGIERDSRIAFARLLRELALDISEPMESRPPGLRGNQ